MLNCHGPAAAIDGELAAIRELASTLRVGSAAAVKPALRCTLPISCRRITWSWSVRGASCDDARFARVSYAQRISGFTGLSMIELHYSRIRLAFGIALLLGFSGIVGFWLVVGFTSGHALLRLIALLAAPFGVLALLGLWPLLRAWRHDGPVVVMDVEGVSDMRQAHAFLAWNDIADIELGSGGSSQQLCFIVAAAARERGDVPGGSTLLTLWRRLNRTGDWNVDLRLIAGNAYLIWQQARKMRETGLRHHVLRLRETLPVRAPAVNSDANEMRLEH